ncbi:MAG: hypothetical protein JNL36_11990 [Candidatus Kapabacteria bacterium]|nr:hypothetical protein [Candidatus Kapabacteria bacterium]
MVTRYSQLLYKSIVISAFVLFGVLGLCIESQAQVITPRFLNCWPPSNEFDNCETINEDSTVVSHLGCDVKIVYFVRKCTTGSVIYTHIEMQRFEIEETTPPCGLINYIYNSSPAPFGYFNEANFREVVTDLYFKLSDALTLPLLNSIPPFLVGAYGYNCDANGNPVNGQYTFQAFEGTCMAYCAIKYRKQVSDGYKTFWSYKWNKCANTCCVLKVAYCLDNSTNPPRWRRSYITVPTGTSPNGDDCTLYNSTESCQSPYIGDPRYQVLGIWSGTCKETCDEDGYGSEIVD